jgi:hypothetical protein
MALCASDATPEVGDVTTGYLWKAHEQPCFAMLAVIGRQLRKRERLKSAAE